MVRAKPGPRMPSGSPADCPRARQEVDAEVQPRAAPQQVLHLLVGLPAGQSRVDVDRDEVGHGQAQSARDARGHHLGDERLQALARAAVLDHVRAEVIGLHEPRERPAFA